MQSKETEVQIGLHLGGVQCSLIAPHMFWIAPGGRSLSSSKDFALTRPVSTRNGGASFVGQAAIPLGGNGFFQGMFQSLTDLLMDDSHFS